ncbi:MAG: hypothetical protein AAGE96_26605, partial [Cyanobacteria bacterium P01_G01_bin.19]
MTTSPLEPNPTRQANSATGNFPQTIVAVSREEFTDSLQLNIRDGKNKPIENLPPELHGHMFVVSPAGSPESAPVAGGNRVVWVTKDGW